MSDAQRPGFLHHKILDMLERHRVMRLSTLRPDGWPQTTTVGYAHDDLTLYFLCDPDSQKSRNLAQDNRVSLTIDHDTPQVMEIRGLSMAARAARITDETEAERALAMLLKRYPTQFGVMLPMPKATDAAIFRVTPFVISVLDYSLGFGHADVVKC